ncbi:unnamed protein product, partial [Brassica napus]
WAFLCVCFSLCLRNPAQLRATLIPSTRLEEADPYRSYTLVRKRILLRARDGIERLERFESAALMDSSDLTSSVKRDITEVQSLCASMDGSKRLLDDSFSSGVAILAKYAEQRDRLNFEVGLSNSVLRLIERHNRVDTCIKYAENNVSISPWNRSHHPMNYHGAGSSAVAYRRSIPSVSLLLLGP